MMLCALLLLLSPVPVVLSLTYHERAANYRSLPDDIGAPGGQYRLVFANAVWRHGDRSPERPLPGDGTDAFGEGDWAFGGGGYGELSPAGMEQQYAVGVKIAARYMDQFQFLSPRYRANQIYVRSTDYNRTLISAYSNLAGMYYGSGRPDVDLPDKLAGWPAGWVPVPVHTVVNKYDYAGNPDASCLRKSQVRQLIIDSDEFASYKNAPMVKETLDYLSAHSQSTVTVENAYYFQDTMTCEKLHIADLTGNVNADVSTWYPWFFSGAVPDRTNAIVGKAIDFQDGLGNPNGVKGVDVSLEMPRLRAGETISTIYDMMSGALRCYRDGADADSCRPFYRNLKYFALSAHDKTLAALLTLLGPKPFVIPLGYPDYGAAVLIELYVEEASGDEYFKVLYHAGPGDNFKAITAYVRGCPMTEDFCPLSVLRDIVDTYTPKPDMKTLCDTDLFADSP